MKFGRGYADWDAEAHTEAELQHVLKTFCLVNKHTPFHVADLVRLSLVFRCGYCS